MFPCGMEGSNYISPTSMNHVSPYINHISTIYQPYITIYQPYITIYQPYINHISTTYQPCNLFSINQIVFFCDAAIWRLWPSTPTWTPKGCARGLQPWRWRIDCFFVEAMFVVEGCFGRFLGEWTSTCFGGCVIFYRWYTLNCIDMKFMKLYIYIYVYIYRDFWHICIFNECLRIMLFLYNEDNHFCIIDIYLGL